MQPFQFSRSKVTLGDAFTYADERFLSIDHCFHLCLQSKVNNPLSLDHYYIIITPEFILTSQKTPNIFQALLAFNCMSSLLNSKVPLGSLRHKSYRTESRLKVAL